MATPAWFVEVVHVASLQKQQEVVELFHGVTGLTATGVSTGADHLVVLECVDNLMKSAAAVLIANIDPDAVRTYVSEPRSPSLMTPSHGGVNYY